MHKGVELSRATIERGIFVNPFSYIAALAKLTTGAAIDFEMVRIDLVGAICRCAVGALGAAPSSFLFTNGRHPDVLTRRC